jgi:hypothetical protein
MRDLEETLAKLFEAVRNLPPGPERYELLKEIGRFRVRLDTIVAKHGQLQAAE